MKPRRIQRKRMKGWRMPRNSVYVGRPTFWGNPFRAGPTKNLGHLQPRDAVALYRTWLEHTLAGAWRLMRLHELRGKDLACWCPLDQPCHADVILELANRENANG